MRGRYTAYIRLKGQPRQSQTFDRKADAIQWAKQHDASARGYARHPRWWKDQLGSYYLSDISPRLIDDCRLDGVEVVVDKSIRGKASAAAGAVVAPRKSRRMKEVMARITS